MNVDKWIFPFAMWFMCVSSNNEQPYENSTEQCLDFCKTQTLSVALGSSVLLPCNFSTIGRKGPMTSSWVSWVHTPGSDLIRLTSEGLIEFLLPKRGRVKAFPNQGSKGNYSIRIDELEESDLGCYRCVQGDDCLQVDVVAATNTQGEDMLLLIYICTGVVMFIMLCVCSYLLYNKIRQENTNKPEGADIEVVSAPPADAGKVPGHEQQRAADNGDLVYENDDQDPAYQRGEPTPCAPAALWDLGRAQPTQSTSGISPNLNQFSFERLESQRTKQRFHRELLNRIRQASFSQHYYVNQRELSGQQAMSAQVENRHRAGLWKKKAKEKKNYQNPIYNRGTDQLNQ